MAKSKATKKFETRHLTDVLKRRKDVGKIKQKIKFRDKQKARRARDNNDNAEEKKPSGGKDLKDMTVDEFFQGFDVPERPTKKRKRGVPSTTKAEKKRTKTEFSDVEQDSSGSDLEEENAGGTTEAPEDLSDGSENEDEESHKKQLESLAEKDPEFFKYLKENDAELLDFEEGDFAEIDELSDEEKPKQKKKKKIEEAEDDEEGEEESSQHKNVLTASMVDKWQASMIEKHSLRTTREVVLAFRSAVHLNEANGREYKYAVTNSDAYNKIMVLALKQLPIILQHHVPIKETASGKYNLSSDSQKFRTLAPMIKSHVASVLHLLSNLSDGSTMRLTLASVLSLLPYTMPYRKVLKDLGKTIVTIWSDPSSDEVTRVAAFLILRKLVVVGDAGIREAILKATYQGLVKGCRNTTVHTLPGINLMKNSAAELWGLDSAIGYTTGFGFVRQLAIHLRSTITNKTKESYKAVYNWQCVHSLDFWSRVLAHHCSSLREAEMGKESPLRPLIYPTVQVTLGIMRLIPTAQYFPLRFQLFRSLLRISRATHTYIPLAPTLYEVLTSAEMRKPPKQSTVRPLDFSTSIRTGKSLLRTRIYQDGVGEQVVEHFAEFFVLWCKSIAFPELVLPVTVMLKRWQKDASDKTKGNNNRKLNSSIALLVQKLEANARWIEQRRAKVDYAPNNRAAVDKFLAEEAWEKTPLGAFVVTARKLREEKEKVLEEARRENDRVDEEEDEDEAVEGAFIGSDGALSDDDE